MTNKVSVSRKWTGPVPLGADGRPLPREQWPRKRRHVWAVRWFAPGADGKIRRPSRAFKTRDEAESFQTEKQAEFNRIPQTRREPRQITIGQFVDEFAEQRIGAKGGRLRAGSMDGSVRTLRRFASFIGPDRKLAGIQAVDANRFFNWLVESDSLAPHTLAKIKRTLKAAFSAAVYLDLLPENPLRKLRVGNLEDMPIRYVRSDEFTAILDVCDRFPPDQALWWRAFLTTLYTAGLRFGEAGHLTWGDIDFANDTIRVTVKRATDQTLAWSPKTAKSIRAIPVPPEAMGLLAELQAVSPDGHAYVFTSPTRFASIKAAHDAGQWPENGLPLRAAQARFPEIVQRAAETRRSLVNGKGKSTVSFHDLRRSCITNWSRTITMQTVMVLAGHTSITTTARYYAAATDDQLELARQASRAALQDTASRQTDPKVTPNREAVSGAAMTTPRQTNAEQ